jgi:hypothetical protein
VDAHASSSRAACSCRSREQIDGTGRALWALAGSDIARLADLATRAAPLAKRAVSWIEVQRLLTRQLQLKHAGLLPLAEPRDNELVRAQLVGRRVGHRGMRAGPRNWRISPVTRIWPARRECRGGLSPARSAPRCHAAAPTFPLRGRTSAATGAILPSAIRPA